jgi:hypothetical protein
MAERLTLWGFDVNKPIALQQMPDETFRLTQ